MLVTEHRVLARDDPRVIGVPRAAVDDDLVTDLDVLDVLAGGPDDAARVAAADVEGLLLALLLPSLDNTEAVVRAVLDSDGQA